MKNLRILLLIAFTCFGTFLFAQDTIYKVNREVIVAKVTEVGNYDIKYKRYSNQDGPVYTIRKTEVWKIVYPGGQVDYFNTASQRTTVNDPNAKLYQNMVGINSFDLLFGVVTVQGEYSFPKGNVAIAVPLSFGVAAATGASPRYSNNIFYYNRDKKFSTGIKILFYPTGQAHMANYYIGVTGEYGTVRFSEYTYYPYPNPYPNPTTVTASFWGTGITNGVQIKPTDRLCICLDASFGMVISDYANNSYTPMGRLRINMGWRFGALPKTLNISN